jgi:hypothetical protein
MEDTFDTTIQDKYLKSGGRGCPLCGGENISAERISADCEYAWAIASCDDCPAEWTDLYTLTGVEIHPATKE